MKPLLFLLLVFIPFRTNAVNRFFYDATYKDSMVLKCHNYEVLDTVLLDKMLTDVESRYSTKYSGAKVVLYHFDIEEKKHLFNVFNYLSSTYGLGYKVYEWLVFGHVVYRGFDIFISGDTPDGVFKKGHSMCSVIMEKVMQNKVYNIHMDYDTKGDFIKEIDLNDVFSR